jgi:regulator of protease activity HflC (stomatin/prohibitin superfamily)
MKFMTDIIHKDKKVSVTVFYRIEHKEIVLHSVLDKNRKDIMKELSPSQLEELHEQAVHDRHDEVMGNYEADNQRLPEHLEQV